MSVEDISTHDWETQLRAHGKMVLLARNAEGEYTFDTLKRAIKGAEFLDPVVITGILSSNPDQSKCTCRAGVGRARCQHKFTFNQIRQARAQWITSSTPVPDMVHKLKLRPENQNQNNKRISYFVDQTMVCRPFFTLALGLSR